MKFLTPEQRAGIAAEKRQSRPSAVRRGMTPKIVLQRIAIDKELGRYFYLVCGHSTDMEIQLLYSVWRPSKGKYYCERCGKWAELPPKKKPAPLPDEPMF